MSIRIAHHRKVSHDTAHVDWRLNQDSLLTRQLSNSIDFSARIALKTNVIETGFYFILDDDQNEDRIFPFLSWWPKPDVVATFSPAIAHDRKTAELGVEVNGSFEG